MEYEVVTLSEKKVVGIEARTNNMAPDMSQVIGGLWNRFYGAGIYEGISGKVTGKGLGIYKDYAGNERNDYTILVACEVKEAKGCPQGTVAAVIPAGKYAKFVVRGDLHQAVAEFWEELWKMDLPRNFVCDFEEYQNDDEKHAEIHIYIGLLALD